MPTVADICLRLQDQQRQRSILIKARVRQENFITATIAGTLGYNSFKDDMKKRKEYFKKAKKLCADVCKGKAAHEYATIIIAVYDNINELLRQQKGIEEGGAESMTALAALLPGAPFVNEPRQRGFGILSLATIVGEVGNLGDYSCPSKLWRRLGCAPWTFDGKVMAGASWKSGTKGKLPKSEWEKFGYSPRRRSIAYVVGENLVKQNKSEYRQRYEYGKKTMAAADPKKSKMQCHRHGMLLATKRLLRNLWCAWNGKEEINEQPRRVDDAVHDTEKLTCRRA